MLEGWSGGGQMWRVKAAGDVAEEALWGPVAAQEQEEKRETGAGRKQPGRKDCCHLQQPFKLCQGKFVLSHIVHILKYFKSFMLIVYKSNHSV